MKPDFKVKNCISLLMLYPNSTRAEKWIEENCWIDHWQDKDGIAIEPRYFDPIYLEIINSGLTIKAF